MSVKPSDTVRWGETAGGTVTSNLTVPSLGEQDRGWTLGEAATSGLFNWLGQRSYKWFKWLSDGDCAFHNLSATGTLDVIGVSTLAGLLNANGGITVPTAQTVALNGTTTLTVGTGATALGGTLGVTGLVTASGGITVPTGQAVTLSGTTTLTVGGLVTASGGITAGSNQHVTVSGTGLFKHGLRTIKVPINGPRTGAGPGITGDVFTMTGSAQAAVFVIPWLPNGSRILGARVRLKDNATGPTTMNFAIEPSVDGTEQAALGTSATSSGSGSTQTLSISGLTATVAGATMTSYYIRVQTISGSALQTIYAIEVDYDQP